MAKLLPGVNDLATTHPALATEADGWDTSSVSAGSTSHKRAWKCSRGHRWNATVANRTGLETGCPYCTNKTVLEGFNDLATTHPELAKEADGWDPETLTAGSAFKKTWRCSLGHQYETEVRKRAQRGHNCPFCSGKRALAGFNDLATTNPDVANEADGWDPSTVTTSSGKKRAWRCELGHLWETTVSSRTSQGTGCPVCTGQKVLKGFNDLASKCPELAKEADGWDPTAVLWGSGKKVAWECPEGHKYEARVVGRTKNGSGCPVCDNKTVLKGHNDLATTDPKLAKEANGWDPTTVTRGSNKKLGWRCPVGHQYVATASSRTQKRGGTNCPFCVGKKVLAGFNDLATTHPELSEEAEGWDPTTVSKGSEKKRSWKCSLSHKWDATVSSRATLGTGCPVCAGQKVLAGFNDLATLLPEVAEEASGWDPTTVTKNSGVEQTWQCKDCGHQWQATTNSRAGQGSGCPECGKGTYKTTLPGWFYLLERPGEQQLGVTNNKERRFRQHALKGWQEVEVVGPTNGKLVLDTETKFKKWLREKVGLVPGTHENWFTTTLEVRSLAELKAKSGVETELF